MKSAEVLSVKAIVFDVFGTLVDWRSSMAREVEALAQRPTWRRIHRSMSPSPI